MDHTIHTLNVPAVDVPAVDVPEVTILDDAGDFSADFALVLRYSRRWIHYGLIVHTVICTVIAAIEGLLYRLQG